MKAYRLPDGSIQLFRPEKNAERMINTNSVCACPACRSKISLQAVKALVETEKDWVPHQDGTSLYIRPFIIATEPHLGVRTSRPISSSSSVLRLARIIRPASIRSRSS